MYTTFIKCKSQNRVRANFMFLLEHCTLSQAILAVTDMLAATE